MKIGFQLNSYTWPGGANRIGEHLANMSSTADDAGFDSMWVFDHFFQIPRNGVPDEDVLEAYNVLGFLAGHTKKMRLGTMATGNTYRHPGMLIKTLTGLDVVSGGRAIVCIGAGWYEMEAKSLGLPFPPVSERFEMLEETLQLMKQMWSGDRSPFQGKHYQLDEPICEPQPLSDPHPPIWVGGGGLKKTLKLAATYGDASNLVAHHGLEDMAMRLEALKRHCDAIGRPYEDIEKTCIGTLHIGPNGMTVKEGIEFCRNIANLGITNGVFNMPNDHELRPVDIIGKEIIPEVAGF